MRFPKQQRPHEIGAGQFKAQCLRLIDEVRDRRQPLIVTKHGHPVVKIVPIDDEPAGLFGALKGTVAIRGDIVAPLDESWDADA